MTWLVGDMTCHGKFVSALFLSFSWAKSVRFLFPDHVQLHLLQLYAMEMILELNLNPTTHASLPRRVSHHRNRARAIRISWKPTNKLKYLETTWEISQGKEVTKDRCGMRLRFSLQKLWPCIKWDGIWIKEVRGGSAMEGLLVWYDVKRSTCLLRCLH